MSLYNVFFTSLPVIALGVFDQDVSAHLCLEFPKLYEEGTKNILFSWRRILGWMLNGVLCSMIIFFGTTNSLVHQVFRKDGQPVDYGVLGVMMYTCVVWTVNCQMAISINYFTWIQHFFIWGSIAIWYVVFSCLWLSFAYNIYNRVQNSCGSLCSESFLLACHTCGCRCHFVTIRYAQGISNRVPSYVS
uniref:Putative ovule protein n=1 Tax=Solanum chacoense TaxID=4108 RepID=A0A0V0HX38_SOLCH